MCNVFVNFQVSHVAQLVTDYNNKRHQLKLPSAELKQKLVRMGLVVIVVVIIIIMFIIIIIAGAVVQRFWDLSKCFL